MATAGTSRHYQIDLPFLCEVHDRWRRRNRLTWLVGGGGFALAVISVVSGKELAGLFLGIAAAGWALVDNSGVLHNRACGLVLTRVHQAAVDAIGVRGFRSTDLEPGRTAHQRSDR